MNTIESIERDIERLDDKSFATIRAWFMEYENARWDRQIEADLASGKLERVIDQALADHQAGKSTPL